MAYHLQRKIQMSALRIAVSSLLRKRGFAAVAILTLALGVGATTAIFSVIQVALLAPLPFPEADRLVMISQRKQDVELLVAGDDFQEWKKANSIESLGAWHEWRGSRTFMFPAADGAEMLTGAAVPASFFKTLGCQPILGRSFGPEEDEPNGNVAAMISYSLWQRRFSGSSNVVGQTITLDNFWRKQYTILGVLPPGFNFPDKSEVWVSRASTERGISGRGHHHKVVARLKPGVSIKQAQAELDVIQSRIFAQDTGDQTADRTKIMPLLDYEIGAQTRPALMMLSVAVAFLLLIACANVANLLLARGAAREKEMAVRIALGARRNHILLQLLAENFALALLGAAVGVVLAYWGLQFLVSLGSRDLPRLGDARLNLVTLAVALGVSTMACFLFGFAPAWQLLHPNLNNALQESGRSSGGRRQNGFRTALVIGEIALTVVLLVGAGLTIKSLSRLQNVELGFDPNHLVVAEFDLSATNYYFNGRDRQFFAALTQRLAARLEIESASGAWYMPVIGRSFPAEKMTVEPNNQREPREIVAAWNAITAGYFETMKTPLVRGRTFTDLDAPNAENLIVINEAAAEQYFPGENPIGRRIAMGTAPFSREQDRRPHWREIIGVVRDLRPRLDVQPFAEVFYPYQSWPWHNCLLVVRSQSPPGRVAEIIRNEVKSLNPAQPVSSIRSMDQILGQSTAQHRFRTRLMAVFSATALFLSAVGLYGVVSYVVSQRAREFGIRLALGATAKNLSGLVVRGGMRMVLIGGALGIVAALHLATALRKLLYQTDSIDPVTLCFAPLTLLFVCLIACLLPAHRASRIDPVHALRHE